MGCGASVPNAAEFLATAQPAPAEGYVATGWPQSIKMKGWSNEVHAYHHPSEGGAMAGMVQWAWGRALPLGSGDLVSGDCPGVTYISNIPYSHSPSPSSLD